MNANEMVGKSWPECGRFSEKWYRMEMIVLGRTDGRARADTEKNKQTNDYKSNHKHTHSFLHQNTKKRRHCAIVSRKEVRI